MYRACGQGCQNTLQPHTRKHHNLWESATESNPELSLHSEAYPSHPTSHTPTRFLLVCYVRGLCRSFISQRWCGAHLARSRRPSSRRWDWAAPPDSLAPSDDMRKWRSLNSSTWSSVWGSVSCCSSRQRSFTHTPDTQEESKSKDTQTLNTSLSIHTHLTRH